MMTDDPEQEALARPKYAEILTAHAMGRVAQKSFLRKEFVRAGAVWTVSAFLFEEGAILGTVYGHVLKNFFVPYCAEPGHTMEELAITESARLDAAFKDASTVHELYLISEMRQARPEASGELWTTFLTAIADERMALADARARGTISAALGVSYGAHYPGHFAELYDASYANIDVDEWKRAHQYGVVSEPEPPPFVPLKERQRVAISEFVEFCETYYPGTLPEMRLS